MVMTTMSIYGKVVTKHKRYYSYQADCIPRTTPKTSNLSVKSTINSCSSVWIHYLLASSRLWLCVVIDWGTSRFARTCWRRISVLSYTAGSAGVTAGLCRGLCSTARTSTQILNEIKESGYIHPRVSYFVGYIIQCCQQYAATGITCENVYSYFYIQKVNKIHKKYGYRFFLTYFDFRFRNANITKNNKYLLCSTSIKHD